MGKSFCDAIPGVWEVCHDVLQVSDSREYANFLVWAKQVFPAEAYSALPAWEQVEGWSGKLIAVCDYEASYTPRPPIWNEEYPVWWHLTNVQILRKPIDCRGNVGMWQLTEDLSHHIEKLKTKVN